MKFISDLHAGRAGEHLVAADVLRRGLDMCQAAQGMPYDLVDLKIAGVEFPDS